MIRDVSHDGIGRRIEEESDEDRRSGEGTRESKDLGEVEEDQEVEASTLDRFCDLSHAVGKLGPDREMVHGCRSLAADRCPKQRTTLVSMWIKRGERLRA